MVEVNQKWVDLFPGKRHEFGEPIRVLGHARMNDGAVRLYYETIEKPAPLAAAPEPRSEPQTEKNKATEQEARKKR